ncbi:MAG: ubiquinol-cytochrome C chaperone family protein [Pseudomonadota bacterium]
MVLNFLKRRRDLTAFDIYGSVAEASRQPELFLQMGVPDTISGRFDMLIAHAVLVLRRLNRVDPSRAEEAQFRSQGFSDVLFKDLDRALRDTGLSDRKAPKKLKLLATVYLGRGKAFGEALDQADQAALTEALKRNTGGVVFLADGTEAALPDDADNGSEGSDPGRENSTTDYEALAMYLTAVDAKLATLTDDEVLQGALAWPQAGALAKSHAEGVGA